MFSLFILLPLASVCLLQSGWAGAGEIQTKSIDFIYVNANTGEAAGGHVALRMGSTVFHFQFFPQSRFLLVRDSWSHFRYVYNELRNRSIFIAGLPLSPEVYTRLRNHFTSLLLVQQQNLDRLREGEDLLRLTAQLAGGAELLELSTVGLLNSDSAEDADMFNLRERILQPPGAFSLSDMREQVERNLADHGDMSGTTGALSRIVRLKGLLLEREFLRLVEQGASLARDVVIVPPIDTPVLTSGELKILEEYREKLAASVVGLLQSGRPDRTESLLLQTARYLVVSRSLATGRLLTLDPFSPRAISVSVEQGDDLQGVYSQLQREANRARAAFFGESVNPDIAYAILETSQGRLHEVDEAIRTGRRIRVEPGILLPGRSGNVSGSRFLERLVSLKAIAEEEAEVLQLRQQVEELYGYDLIRKNCATELVRTVYSAFPDRETGRRELGGWLDPDSGLVCIPNRFYGLVKEQFPVQEEEVLPSRRLRQLNALYGRGYYLPVWLRESNVISSTLYTPRTKDTPFLFFTDDAALLRPVFGISNFCWAAVHGVGGVLTLPVDGGERIHQGLRGIFYSLPELVFHNIRKGTYGYAELVTAGP